MPVAEFISTLNAFAGVIVAITKLIRAMRVRR